MFLLAILPSLIILNIVYNSDSEKEPKKLLIALFGLGIISCFITFLITDFVLYFVPSMKSDVVFNSNNYLKVFIYSFLIVGCIEEFSKWIFNVTIGWNNKNFDQIYDAIVYSVFISLGFASFENFLYIVDNGFNIVLIRSILSVPAHAFFGVAMGSYLGLSKYNYYTNNKKMSVKNFVLSLMVPVLLHGIYDFCIFSDNRVFYALFFVLIILLYIYAINKIYKVSKNNINIINNKNISEFK